MIINFYKIILSLFLIFFSFSCSDPEDNGSSSNDAELNESTLNESLSGQSLNLQEELFFDFEKDVRYTYNYYSVSGIGWGNTISNPCVIRESDSLAFFTFPDYLLESKNCDEESIVCGEDDTDYANYVNHSLFSEFYGYTEDTDGDGEDDPICSCACIDAAKFSSTLDSQLTIIPFFLCFGRTIPTPFFVRLRT